MASSAGTLPEILAARSAEVAEAVASAIASHIVPSSAWLTAEHARRESATLRTSMVARVISLAATGERFSDDDRRFHEDLGVLFARQAVPLRLLAAASDVGTAAIIRESWRIAPAGYLTEMTRFTDSATSMMRLGLQASARAYQAAGQTAGQAAEGSRPARWVPARAVNVGDLIPAARPPADHQQLPASSRPGRACPSRDSQQATSLLGELALTVWTVPGLGRHERRQILDGIYAITAQLAASAPDMLLVASLWNAVTVAVTLSGATGLTTLTRQVTQVLTRVTGLAIGTAASSVSGAGPSRGPASSP